MTESPRQLALDLPSEPRHGREDFLVSPSNRAAFDLFEKWPAWPDTTLLLIGPEGAGKSHLGAIWAERAGAVVVPAEALPRADLPALARAPAILIEDADRARDVERAMFHLLNLTRDNGVSVVATARAWPDHWRMDLPDLLSRLRRAPAVEIGEPDEALVRAVLVKLFFDRQLTIEAPVVDFLALRIERSLGAVRKIVEGLDHAALEKGRGITRPMAAEFLKGLYLGE